jgi:hypothetical protein
MAPGLLMTSVCKQMKAQTWMINVKGMDHGFNFKSKLEAEKLCNALGVIAGTWLGERNGASWDDPVPWDADDSREMKLLWNKDLREVQLEVCRLPATHQQGLTVRVDAADGSKLVFNLGA